MEEEDFEPVINCCKTPIKALSITRSGSFRGSLTGLSPVSSMSNTTDDKVVSRHNVDKSSEDKREYLGLILQNKMKVLLVSDPTTDKSAAALDVNVGVMSDPPEFPGLAHFCEHMLFLGTKKYPQENEYSKFLSENGGESNACTFLDHTCFYFDVVPEKLSEALDIFAQFFISPMFTSNMTERELNAVDSEHSKNLISDSWRLDQLNRSTADPTHPYCKFGTGNKYTLDEKPKEMGVDIREELLKFHNQWYSSNIMSLTVLGKESLPDLEKLVVELFSDVEDKQVERPEWLEHPYPPAFQGMRAFVTPVKDLRNLSITCPIPDYKPYYKSGPGHYLAHLLGHEGPGSLLSALKKRGWCNSLVGGIQSSASGFGFFGVQVDLTEDGILHVDDIIKLAFQYVNMLKRLGPVKWVHDEHSLINDMHFRFKDKMEPRSFVASYVHSLQEYPFEDVLTALYRFTEWRPDLVSEMLDLLAPERVRVVVVGKVFETECDLTEKWYGTKYKLEPIPKETLQSWRDSGECEELFLPLPNEFIPSTFDLAPLEESGKPPVIIKDTPRMRVWHKQDDEYFLPKLNTAIELDSPMAYVDPISCNMTTLLTMLFRDALNEYAYAAECAGTHWSISNTKSGISLRMEGYDSKQHVLLEKIMERLVQFKVDPKRYEVMLEMYARNMRNFNAEQPYQHGIYHLAILLTDTAWTKGELLEAINSMSVEILQDFIPRLLASVHVEILVHGNATKVRALEIAELVENSLPKSCAPLLPQQLLPSREIQLEKGSNFRMEAAHTMHPSSCIVVYYQYGMQSVICNVVLELFLQIISEPCFNILRTKEQLGYIVFSGMRRSNGVQGLRVIIQSEKHPVFLEERVEAFLDHMGDHIENMSEEEYERHRNSLMAQRLKKPKMMAERTTLLWSEIKSQQYHFDRTNVEVAALRCLSKQQILDFYHEFISIDSPDRQKLCVMVISKSEGGAGLIKPSEMDAENVIIDMDELTPQELSKTVIIDDVIAFKSGRSLFPQLKPYTNIPRKGATCKL